MIRYIGLYTLSDGIRPVRKNLFLEFLQSREPVVGLCQELSIFPCENLLLMTDFDKPLIDLFCYYLLIVKHKTKIWENN